MNLLDLFRRGYDTKDIAKLLKRDEHDIYNAIHKAREEERRHLIQDKPIKARRSLRLNRAGNPLIQYQGYDPRETA